MNTVHKVRVTSQKLLGNHPLLYRLAGKIEYLIKRIIDHTLIFSPENIRIIVNIPARVKYRIKRSRINRLSVTHNRNYRGDKRSACVVTWSLNSNPAGRAYVLADMLKKDYNVEMLGYIFSNFNQEIWEPLEEYKIPIWTIKAGNTFSFIRKTVKFVCEKQYDVIYISKPRFPGILTGVLYKLIWGSKVLLDIDDYELSFFENRHPLHLNEFGNMLNRQNMAMPHEEIWTRLSDSLTDMFDAVTVSNIVLQKKYGGIIVRHARNEDKFDPDNYSRDYLRKKYGFKEHEIIILFLGTPRPHKGLMKTAMALEKISDDNVLLCIVGKIADSEFADEFKRFRNARIKFLPNQPFDKIPEIMSMADIVCILQDKNSVISQYQIPAKLTDALAMKIPVIISDVPPLEDLPGDMGIIRVDNGSFVEKLKTLIYDQEFRKRKGEEARTVYLNEFTYKQNRRRIEEALNVGMQNKVKSPRLYDIIDMIDKYIPSAIDPYIMQKITKNKKNYSSDISGNGQGINIVFFWKQNDSGIYGRRQDMIVKYLMKSGKVNNILHFDVPISTKEIYSKIDKGLSNEYHQGARIAHNCIERFLKLQDFDNIYRRTFVYGKGPFLGRDVPRSINDYPKYVEECMKEAGITDNVMAWVCPVVWEFPDVQKRIGFPYVVADVIDDQSAFGSNKNHNKKVINHYKTVLPGANLCIVNCDKMKDMVEQYSDSVLLVPNGAEVFENTENWDMPPELEDIKRPILGYVGNLSVRIDYDLLEGIAREKTDCSIVLIGSVHNNDEKLKKLKRYSNIHLMGVIPYKRVIEYIRFFDCAIIPHEDNSMTKSMDPLKLYLFLSLGIPVISTNISIDDTLKEYVYIAENCDDFIKKIDIVLKQNNSGTDNQINKNLLKEISWGSKVKKIFSFIEDKINN